MADFIVNCTGPRAQIGGSPAPLLRSLQRHGLLRPDPLALGVDALPDGTLLSARGSPVPWLTAIGPPLKGVLWETTAVPEIRQQAAALADQGAPGPGAPGRQLPIILVT
jgi:uncharacterized NAD(P)/FAD-binding protein YdhS